MSYVRVGVFSLCWLRWILRYTLYFWIYLTNGSKTNSLQLASSALKNRWYHFWNRNKFTTYAKKENALCNLFILNTNIFRKMQSPEEREETLFNRIVLTVIGKVFIVCRNKYNLYWSVIHCSKTDFYIMDTFFNARKCR